MGPLLKTMRGIRFLLFFPVIFASCNWTRYNGSYEELDFSNKDPKNKKEVITWGDAHWHKVSKNTPGYRNDGRRGSPPQECTPNTLESVFYECGITCLDNGSCSVDNTATTCKCNGEKKKDSQTAVYNAQGHIVENPMQNHDLLEICKSKEACLLQCYHHHKGSFVKKFNTGIDCKPTGCTDSNGKFRDNGESWKCGYNDCGCHNGKIHTIPRRGKCENKGLTTHQCTVDCNHKSRCDTINTVQTCNCNGYLEEVTGKAMYGLQYGEKLKTTVDWEKHDILMTCEACNKRCSKQIVGYTKTMSLRTKKYCN